jgi:hypothetical protein
MPPTLANPKGVGVVTGQAEAADRTRRREKNVTQALVNATHGGSM